MVKPKKLSKKEESDLCLACAECCKRYAITVLPDESKKISKLLGKKEKDFLENDCVISVKLFPKSVQGVLTYPTTFFPKQIYAMLEHEFGRNNVPPSFFIVPQVVLKRYREGERDICGFLGEKNACEIYSTRPQPCRLFPFIAMPGLREQYPFCVVYQRTYKDLSKESCAYYKKVKQYFRKVHLKGFASLWKTPPLAGQIYLNDKPLGGITLEELETMLVKTKPKK